MGGRGGGDGGGGGGGDGGSEEAGLLHLRVGFGREEDEEGAAIPEVWAAFGIVDPAVFSNCGLEKRERKRERGVFCGDCERL